MYASTPKIEYFLGSRYVLDIYEITYTRTCTHYTHVYGYSFVTLAGR